MPIWFGEPSIAALTAKFAETLVDRIGIEFVEIGLDYLVGRMPVDAGTIQSKGCLHGGASVALAETLGSAAANLCVDPAKSFCVGLEINANHLRPETGGFVTATARPVHLGKSTHVWGISIVNAQGQLVCVSRHTVAVRRK